MGNSYLPPPWIDANNVIVDPTGSPAPLPSVLKPLLLNPGAITPSSTIGIIGTKTNDNANAGSIGEFPAPTNLTNVSATSGTPVNVASVPLSAGDWEVSGVAQFNPSGTTNSSLMLVGSSSVSGARGAFGSEQVAQISFLTGAGQVFAAPPTRFSLAAPTVVYIVAQANFSGGTLTITGSMHVRRAR